MSQIKQINQTLKQLLRQHQLTYKDIAQALKMSEANVKRIFANQSFTLDRLEEICQLININLSDLFLLSEKQSEQLSQLTLEQEQELMDDPELFLVAVCVRDGWQFAEIIQHYQISEHQCIRLLARLDKLKMIDLLPNNHYKLLIAQDFRWIPNGPLAKFMEREVMGSFMADKFNQPGSFRFYLRGSYSTSSLAIIERKLNQLTKEVALLNQEDTQLPLEQRQHTGLLLAMRPWQISLFEQFKRTNTI
ncbi:helix-turn-helix domain-containing protein [Pseudoalteromonas tunicata]|uniref:helix-turn-helix domain-containing protein n=1 Tax=Pseudoalteromonas tunicata TaxID=314281 RepID=UPI00273E5FCB|nr:helix-turn-helix transcriptional regulator [Pseudoalteromonas tunicata]MDP4984557.1 helix-turn-helix transcriptional regulator [Pseudoalteromonas tunicata]MDP5212802.1 helix-turn-helix transcriptional regulator [Pseudoalteromonas tunicata]